jgi:hypothetical protein
MLLGVDQPLIDEADDLMQLLLSMSNGESRRTTYISRLEQLMQLIDKISYSRELRFSERAYIAAVPAAASLSVLEESIFSSLTLLIPSAARSYRQAIQDLTPGDRLSYKGPANEFRESLRETLDHLAPDEDVEGSEGFEYEDDQKKPTMRQKIRYILKARGQGKREIAVPLTALETVDEKIAILGRATYTRSNISAHVETERVEVQRLRNYTNAILAELLEISD